MHKKLLKDTIDIEEDISFQRKFWRIERVGWVIFFIFLCAVLLGFTGQGTISNTKIEQEDISVEYSRYARRLGKTELKINLENTTPNEIRIPDNFLKRYQIEQIYPQPTTVRFSGEDVVYIFGSEPNNSTIIFYLTPQELGNMAGAVKSKQQEVAISQFIYP